MSLRYSSNRLQARDVLAAVVVHNTAKWVRFAERVLGSGCDAEDVLQESVRRVLVRNRLFLSEEEMRMYLGRTISNTAIEFYHARRRARRRQIPLQHHLAKLSEKTNPHLLLEERESGATEARMMAVLDSALESLPSKQYEALRMTVFNPKGPSMRMASALNGIPYSTLRHRSRQGLRRLKKLIQRELRWGASRLKNEGFHTYRLEAG